MGPKPNAWLGWPKPNPLAQMRLFCFPYAGGSALIYRNWPERLISEVEVCAINLPGRAQRLREAPYTRLSLLVEELAPAVRPFLDKPFAFFGHSMGAMISFELARHLRREQALAPAHLFLSGRGAPHLVKEADTPTFDLPDEEFVRELRRLKGTPQEVLDNPELMQLMIPLLRADFTVCQTYEYRQEPPLDCPITAFGGLQDKEVPREQLEGWREHTSSTFRLVMLPGDHFFLNSQREVLLRILSQELSQSLRPTAFSG